MRLLIVGVLSLLASKSLYAGAWGPIAVDPNARAYVIQENNLDLTRFPSDAFESDVIVSEDPGGFGSVDSAAWFPDSQKVRIFDIAVSHRGNIFVAGSALKIEKIVLWDPTATRAVNRLFVACLKPDGKLNSAYNGTGISEVASSGNVTDVISSIGVDAGENVTAVLRHAASLDEMEGDPSHLARIQANGTLDLRFGIIDFPRYLWPGLESYDMEINHVTADGQGILLGGSLQSPDERGSETFAVLVEISLDGKTATRLDKKLISMGSVNLNKSSVYVADRNTAYIATQSVGPALEVSELDLLRGSSRRIIHDPRLKLYSEGIVFRGKAFVPTSGGVLVSGVASDDRRVLKPLSHLRVCSAALLQAG